MKKLLLYFTGSIAHQSAWFESLYLLFRLHVGLSIAFGAGLPKVFHKIDEKGTNDWANLAFGVPERFVKQVSEIGFTFIGPEFWAYLAVYGEFIGGLLIALGLLTRLSAAQLAFQFFVISYVWYGDPEPIVGMYYQQLYFFAFVMALAVGDGRYSLANLFTWLGQRRSAAKLAVAATILGLALTATNAQAQTDGQQRVSFTLGNSSLRGKMVEFRSFDSQRKLVAGYGYWLNGLEKHPVNLPAPVMVYLKKNGKDELLVVVRPADNGKHFSVNQTYPISREDALEEAYLTLNTETAALEAANPEAALAQTAKEKGLKMVSFRVKGASAFPVKVYVRVQLPWDPNPKANTGFTTTLSRSKLMKMTYPVGTRVYVCDGPYWEKDRTYQERLVVAVDEEKENYLFIL
jgi:uncharacterized membrane protein YphA (DoxX/SURF4 family)